MGYSIFVAACLIVAAFVYVFIKWLNKPDEYEKADIALNEHSVLRELSETEKKAFIDFYNVLTWLDETKRREEMNTSVPSGSNVGLSNVEAAKVPRKKVASKTAPASKKVAALKKPTSGKGGRSKGK